MINKLPRSDPSAIVKLLDQIMNMTDKKKVDQKLGEIADTIYFGYLEPAEIKQVLQKMILSGNPAQYNLGGHRKIRCG